MRAPINKPTDKTKKRLEQINSINQVSKSVNPETKYVELDMQTLLNKMMSGDMGEKLTNEIIKTANKKLDTEESINIVRNFLSEYFDSYMLMGYGINGKRTIIHQAKSDQQEDSIFELVRYVFMSMVQQGNN